MSQALMPENGPETPGKPSAVRLQAWLARAGVASRRAAEGIILAGRVAVNGTIVTELGSKVGEGDEVALDGKPLRLEERKRYLLLNKPRGYVSSMADPEGRPLAVALLKSQVPERVYNVGRLDQWSSGLLLFTNDGDLAALLVHPSGGIEKEYEVDTDIDIPDGFIRDFEQGLVVEGVRYRAERARKLGPRRARLVLIEGKNREIRRVLAAFGLRALALKRVRIGPILLGDLAEGSFRELLPGELEALRRTAAGPKPLSHR